MVTVLVDGRELGAPEGRGADDRLWLPADVVARELNWELKPQGFCQGERCVPIPPGREDEFVDNGEIDVAALWRRLGRPALHDAAGDTWSLGESAAERRAQLESLEAPDFALPDREGRTHRLSDYRGRKVLLVTWASW